MVDGYNQNTLCKSIKFPNNKFKVLFQNKIVKYQEKRKCEGSLDCKKESLESKKTKTDRQTDRDKQIDRDRIR